MLFNKDLVRQNLTAVFLKPPSLCFDRKVLAVAVFQCTHRKPASAEFPPYPSQHCFLYGVHTEQAGRHACALQHWSRQSLSPSVPQSLSPTPSMLSGLRPVLAWPGSSCRTPEDDQVDVFSHTQGSTRPRLMLTAALTSLFIIYYPYSLLVPLGLAYKCSVSFSLRAAAVLNTSHVLDFNSLSQKFVKPNTASLYFALDARYVDVSLHSSVNP